LLGEPEDVIFPAIPHTVQGLESTMRLQPSVKELTWVNWFSRVDGDGIRRLTGEITVVPPDDDAQLITRYDLYWGDENHVRLLDAPRLAFIPGNGALTYSFPVPVQVPRHAAHVIAYGRSSHGFSPTAAAVPIGNTWLDGIALGTAAAAPTIP